MTIPVTIKHAGTGDKVLEVVENSSNGTTRYLKAGEEVTLPVYDERTLLLREAVADRDTSQVEGFE